MSMIVHDPDDYVTEITHRTCEHHKREPWDVGWPGCTCSSGYSVRHATSEERAANIKAREAEQERRRRHMEAYDRGTEPTEGGA